jgi:ADP-dependent glucokinase
MMPFQSECQSSLVVLTTMTLTSQVWNPFTNEQELPNLLSMLQYGNVSLLSDAHPRVASVLDQMRLVYKLLKDTKEIDGRRKLTRLHVHTLAYQAIMTTKGSPWKNTMSATAKASLTAHRHVCGSNYIHTEKSKLLMDESFASSISSSSTRISLHENRPVSCWDEDDYEICVAPVLVCTQVRQTAGGFEVNWPRGSQFTA